MKRFSVRVELLNDATGTDYQELHMRLQAAGFGTIIVADNQGKWHLPPAEYVHVASSSAQAVRNQLNDIIQKGLRAGLAYRTFVVEFVDWASENLRKA